jgi:hypothetical protein
VTLRRWLMWAALVLGSPVLLLAQGGEPPPPPPPPPPPVDTLPPPPVHTVPPPARRDTGRVARDSITFAPPDSLMRALMARTGYQATRYEADSVRFTAGDRRIILQGMPAAVQRGTTALSGDTIEYDNAAGLVDVRSRTILVRDPAQGNDVTASGSLTYRLDERRVTATDMRTAAQSTSVWYIRTARGGFVNDTGGGTFYGREAALTTDPDSVPHYRFLVGEVKQVSKNVMVARPAVLYIGEVPILWIPFLYQDLRDGRRSGLLTPRFGVGELVRNSSSYRRTVENLGYYFALSEYFDAQVSLDWRSGSRPTEPDPGWLGVNGQLRYAWRDRFLSGSLGASQLARNDGATNLSLSWQHQQAFSKATSLNANINYVTSTAVQQQTMLNPMAAIANITSQANFQTQFGPLRASLGGTMRQFPGREEIQQDFPTLNITSQPIELAEWLTWTPSLNTSSSRTLKSDTPSEFSWQYVVRDGLLDSTRVERNSRNTSLTVGSPFKLGNFNINAGLRVRDQENDFPEAKVVIDPSDTTQRRTIVYQRTYLTSVDWDFSMNLPQFLQGSWNFTPNITLQNVDPAGFLVRSERTGSAFVSQSKRLQYGASVSPTFFGLFPGIGPFSRIRHSITPAFSYTYSPEATVSDAFLSAIGRTRAGYLGALAQNRVSLSLTQNIEAKFRGSGDTSVTGEERKIRLLSLQFSALEYDFERAKATGGSGFATERFNVTMRSDLVPGLDLGVDYSLFQGSVLSDTAVFSPYPETMRASLSMGRSANLLAPLGRVLGWATGERSAPVEGDTLRTASPAMATGTIAGQSNQVGGVSRPALMEVPTGQGWQANLTFTSTRRRPPVGGNVFAVDPRTECEPLRTVNPLQYEVCLRQRTPAAADDFDLGLGGTGGGAIFVLPPQASIQGSLTFNLTRQWAAQWQTSFDVQRQEFASQIVSLQRDLLDWRAMFGFTQAPNGNFAFNFLITLKPAPDIKMNYDRQTFRSGGVAPR